MVADGTSLCTLYFSLSNKQLRRFMEDGRQRASGISTDKRSLSDDNHENLSVSNPFPRTSEKVAY